ncbi:GTP cyclohydrolase I FolE [Bartonella sp. F02]|uniref:GTP cyclohydrolase I FolE n=1 Tax=Bartonella sp. F02 TaxID=2967262 RepID=UPI0022A95CD0|nr:GTP cyclohydrolase I FolE [Bartonella sp. F02]MCZ2328308.1 GTP cyclohydrolase I FolE [Bartonella sp. F02]
MHSIVKGAAADSVSFENKRPSLKEVEAAVRTLLLWIGENPNREGLLDTPSRVAKAYGDLFSGYNESVEEILGTVFEEVSGYNEPVIIKDIPFYSHCEHHMIPIVGKAHIAYLPDKKVVGLSKVARVVNVFSRRLQTQETMTAQVADALNKYLKPRGVAILIEAEHMCMVMRGVQKHGTTTITTSFRGYYEKNSVAQSHFMTMIRRS